MAHTFPKVGEWDDAIANAGTRGFNPLVDFERELHRTYPDLRPYTFCFSSESDMNSNQIIGWRPLMASMFDVEDFSSAVGLRYGIRADSSDHVRLGDNYVLLMPKQHREIVLNSRKEADNNMKARSMDAAAYVHPSDPEYNKMKDAAKKIAEEGSETYKVQVKGEPDHGESDTKAPSKGK
jgi:hypothetical protein